MKPGDKDHAMTIKGLIAILQRAEQAGAYYVYGEADGVQVALDWDKRNLSAKKYPCVTVR